MIDCKKGLMHLLMMEIFSLYKEVNVHNVHHQNDIFLHIQQQVPKTVSVTCWDRGRIEMLIISPKMETSPAQNEFINYNLHIQHA